MSGGLYRMVTLVSTEAAVHVALDDSGRLGCLRPNDERGESSDGERPSQDRQRRNRGRERTPSAPCCWTRRACQRERRGPLSRLAATTTADVVQDVGVATPHLWQGVQDPYLYTLRVEVLNHTGAVVDRVSQGFGIRQMAFDPDRGFSLNGRALPLHGVAMHQDFLGKGWAIADRDTDESLALVKEIGANTLRLAHYPHARHTLDRADEMGLVVWAEVPFVNGVRLSCTNEPATRTSWRTSSSSFAS